MKSVRKTTSGNIFILKAAVYWFEVCIGIKGGIGKKQPDHTQDKKIDNRLLLLITSRRTQLKALDFTSEMTLHSWYNSITPDIFHFTLDRAFISVFIHQFSKC